MQLYVQWVKQFGNIMCWRLGSTPMVVLSDPADWVTLLSGKELPPLPKLTRMYQVIEVVSVRTSSSEERFVFGRLAAARVKRSACAVAGPCRPGLQPVEACKLQQASLLSRPAVHLQTSLPNKVASVVFMQEPVCCAPAARDDQTAC